jgi:cyanophycinase
VTAGPLVAIGGAEDKLGRKTVLKTFLALAGGSGARIVVLPTASAMGGEIVDVYAAVFRRLGAGEVVSVRPESRAEADDPHVATLLDEAGGVFMTGGNQLKLAAVVTGTALGEAVVAAHRRGAAVGGTSAGASILSAHMVAFGSGGATPKQRMTQVSAGLGLLPGAVVDQHFEQRNRYGRLLSIVAQSPSLLGIGVDEDTAAVVTHEDSTRRLVVTGRGAVTVVDGSGMVTNAFDARRSSPLLASGVTLHVLPAGAEFDLDTRALLSGPPLHDPDRTETLAVAGHDLRRLARDIDADDVSPTALRRRQARQQRRRSGVPSRPTRPDPGGEQA